MSFFFDRWLRFLVGALVFLFFLISVQNVYAPPLPPPDPTYANSAHGDSNGVDRKSPFPDYAIGNCAHCHEQHASIGGSELAPTGGPDDYLLFNPNHTSQTVNFCFDCHDNTTTYATAAIVNRSYSYRAGEWTDDTLDDIKEAFDTANTSYHQLDDIVTFITDKWGYTADSNPCVACHNPHTVQGDPGNASTGVKSFDTRGYLVSRPTEHANLSTTGIWNIWGDQQTDETETMSDYTAYYQAPYRNGGVANGYEPDGSTTTDGSNLTDYVTFCQDCHASYSLPNTPIDWTTTGGESGGDKHGKNIATATSGANINLKEPYLTAWTTSGLVVACTDCHEPHGAPNVMLIRNEVNGAALAAAITTITSTDCTPAYSDYNKELGYLCNRCHVDDLDHYGGVAANRWYWVHHDSPDRPYTPSSCSGCHSGGGSSGYTSTRTPINCNCCHYHGSSAASRVTF